MLAENPKYSALIYWLKYFQILIYFISRDTNTFGLAGSTTNIFFFFFFFFFFFLSGKCFVCVVSYVPLSTFILLLL
jgi:hypothetical protein